MINFSRFQLDNGLQVIVHEDDSTPMAAVNVLYKVGARDESPDKTGFAHLFEHLMFSGSANVPDFDRPIQMAGGENNAFTNNDITNFYDIVPADNLELIFWLESDRMLSLNINELSLDVQRKVVVEEFKESCLNQPYGDAWHHIAELAYEVHPYRWPTIGKVPQHIEEATLEEVKEFYQTYYRPNNAVLSVAGKVTLEQVKTLAEKWFGNIPKGATTKKAIPSEPVQKEFHQRVQKKSTVPADALYMAFHGPARDDATYYSFDLLSDILANGRSSRLYRKLLKEKRLFTEIDAYITGSIDPGLLIIEGKPTEGTTLQEAEAAIWQELQLLTTELVPDQELQKVKNKVESTLIFSEASVLNKAINLAFFEALDQPNLINEEASRYQQVTAKNLQQVAKEVLTRENCSEVVYLAEAK